MGICPVKCLSGLGCLGVMRNADAPECAYLLRMQTYTVRL